MFEREFALLSLFERAGRIRGRKKLQKTVHLLQFKGVPFNLDYTYHYYGPYSSELQIEIDNLVKQGFLREFMEGDMYVYEITEKGAEFLRAYREFVDSNFDIPDDLLEKLLNKNTQVLEIASTYAYLLESGYSYEKAEKEAKKLKEHLAVFFEDARELVEEEAPF